MVRHSIEIEPGGQGDRPGDVARAGAGIPEFDLSGGALCLDFANTCSRGSETGERLDRSEHFLAFADAAGLLDRGEAQRVLAGIRADEAGAAAVLARALRFREALYRILAAIAAERTVDPADLEIVNRQVRRSFLGLRAGAAVGRGSGPPVFAWKAPESDGSLEGVLHPIACDALGLLTAPDLLGRVRECGARGCTWLFLDQSRNRSRRWCSMEVCGNRAKARRHYRRQRTGGGSG